MLVKLPELLTMTIPLTSGVPAIPGKINLYDATDGALAPVLPLIFDVGEGAIVGYAKNDGTANKVVATCQGGDTIAELVTELALTQQLQVIVFQAMNGSWHPIYGYKPTVDPTDFALTLLDDANAAAARATLGARGLVKRITAITSNAQPAWSWDSTDQVNITAQAVDFSSMTLGITGTPTDGQQIVLRIKDNGTGRGFTWGSAWREVGTALPTTTVAGKTLYVGGVWNAADSVIDTLAVQRIV